MRLVQVTIPAGKREAVLSALDDEGVDYVVTDETSGREYTAVVTFPLPTNAVEPVLESLREAGLDEESYTIILDAETVVSRRFEELQERYAEEEETGSEDRIAREELVARAGELAPALTTYLVMTTVSAVIATAGLLLDSPAVVVGSMVIAPLIGPAMATSVGTVVNDREMFLRGVKLQVLGFGLAIVAAGVFAATVRVTGLVPPGTDITAIPEIRERLSPDFLSLAVAIGAGTAGVLSLSTGVSTALVGVMIAVALVPPAATVGIGAAWGMPAVSAGAGILGLVNWLSINLAALVVLWIQGYRPEGFFDFGEARTATIERVGVLLAAILLLSAFLGATTYASYQTGTFRQQSRDATDAVVADYDGLSVIEYDVVVERRVFLNRPTEVIVTVGRPPDGGEQFPGLAGDVAERIRERTGRDVTVQVRFVEVASAG
ncbi:MAG: TIGR00341 family protein [Halobacteriaceae archaeon]